jgi:hypothetical protein
MEWPEDVSDCHALLTAMDVQRRVQRQTLQLAGDCVRQLETRSIDNLDLYQRVSHSRLKDGHLKSTMLHAVVSERILFPKTILLGPAPTGDLLIKDSISIAKHAALPNRATTEAFGRIPQSTLG